LEHAIRNYLERVDSLIENALNSDTLKSEGPIGGLALIEDLVTRFNMELEEKYKKYQGVPESIIIRLPDGLSTRILSFALKFGYNNIQNLARFALIAQEKLDIDKHNEIMEILKDMQSKRIQNMSENADKTMEKFISEIKKKNSKD
jgi:hypothetical protein